MEVSRDLLDLLAHKVGDRLLVKHPQNIDL